MNVIICLQTRTTPYVVKLGTAAARIVLVKKTATIAEEIRENIARETK